MPPFGMAMKRKAEEMDETADGDIPKWRGVKEWKLRGASLKELDDAIDSLIKAVAYG